MTGQLGSKSFSKQTVCFSEVPLIPYGLIIFYYAIEAALLSARIRDGETIQESDRAIWQWIRGSKPQHAA